jgi:predicted RNA-binding Zn ribbon-like protein
MSSFVLDGLVLPVALAGHPALDFCNTRAGWGRPEPKEYLASHTHLSLWARENGLITAASHARLGRAAARQPARAATVLARTVAFRDALYAVLVRPGRSADWAGVNAEVRRAAATVTLRPGRPSHWELSNLSDLELPLLAVAWSAAELLTSTAAASVSACPGAGCGWLFADPHGRRRWCTMAVCGNRNKVARHAERRRVKNRTYPQP